MRFATAIDAVINDYNANAEDARPLIAARAALAELIDASEAELSAQDDNGVARERLAAAVANAKQATT
jgi:hypothetical protein